MTRLKTTPRLKITFLITAAICSPANAEPLGGVESIYSLFMTKRSTSAQDAYQHTATPDSNGLSFVCLKDPKDEYYVGAAQFQTIDAPIEAVAKILTSFDRYSDWTDGLVESYAKKLAGDKFLVSTEQEIPVPFVSNIHTQLIYEVKTAKDRVTLRYQLGKSDSLTAYDGVIVLESTANHGTRFAEYDILNADWGVAKAMGAKKIWSDSLKAMYQGDFALKTQAENPSMPVKEVRKKSIKMAGEQDFKDCFEKRVELSDK